MKKSEHTEIFTLTRLAVFASQHSLAALTYGNAAEAAHLSRGAIQRIFPSKSILQQQTLQHAARLLEAHVFAPDKFDYAARWADWIEGKAGLPGACVVLDCLQSRALVIEIRHQAWQLVQRFLLKFLSPARQSGNSDANESELAHELLAHAVYLSGASAQFHPALQQVARSRFLAICEQASRALP
jgi:AcrR family transcriptional regulator